MATRDELLRILDRQGEGLARLEDAEVRRMLEIYDEAGRELAAILEAMEESGADLATPFTFQRYQATLAQLEAGIRAMEQRLGATMTDAARRLGERSIEDLLSLLGSAERDFRGVATPIQTRALRSLQEVQGLLLHKASLDRYARDTVDEIQRRLLIARARGETFREIRRDLFGIGRRNQYEAYWLKQRHRVELITRMENTRVVDEVNRESLRAASEVLDVEDDPDPLLARADEFRDHRNHPLSPALHGRVRRLDEDWVVSQAEVKRWEAVTKYRGPPSSILWPLVDGAFVGRTYPAHFNDRGRSTPWRLSWGDSGAMTPPDADG